MEHVYHILMHVQRVTSQTSRLNVLRREPSLYDRKMRYRKEAEWMVTTTHNLNVQQVLYDLGRNFLLFANDLLSCGFRVITE